MAGRLCIKCVSVGVKGFASEVRAWSLCSELAALWFSMSVADPEVEKRPAAV